MKTSFILPLSCDTGGVLQQAIVSWVHYAEIA
jgi:hypothetical protein